jgi:hypothetical protein
MNRMFYYDKKEFSQNSKNKNRRKRLKVNIHGTVSNGQNIMTITRKPESRFHFRFNAQDFCLHVDAQENFGTSLRFLPWEKGLVCERFNKNEWVRENADPGIPLITLCNDQTLKEISPDCPAEQHPVEVFVNLIPQIVRDLAAPFVFQQIPLLQFLRVVPEAVELARSNPVLLWLLVDKITQTEANSADFRQVVLTKLMEILHTINSDWDETSLSFISRISFPRYTENAMKTIRVYLKDSEFIGRLSSFHRIPGVVLEHAIKRPRIRNSPAFLHLLSSTNKSEPPQKIRRILFRGERMIREVGDLGKQLGLREVDKRISKCKTIDEIEKLHCKWYNIKSLLSMAKELNMAVAKEDVLDKMGVRAIKRISDKLLIDSNKRSC